MCSKCVLSSYDAFRKENIMIAYLTSQIGGSYKKDGTRIPTQLNTENGLLDSLQNTGRIIQKF